MARRKPRPERLYSLEEVRVLCGFSNEEQVRELIADGRFPAPIQHSRQSPPLWSGEILLAWIKLQPALRREAPAERPRKGAEN